MARYRERGAERKGRFENSRQGQKKVQENLWMPVMKASAHGDQQEDQGRGRTTSTDTFYKGWIFAVMIRPLAAAMSEAAAGGAQPAHLVRHRARPVPAVDGISFTSDGAARSASSANRGAARA
jgi:hypothetical protein